MVLCTSVHGLQTNTMRDLDMAGRWRVQAFHLHTETSFELPHFTVDSLVNICDLEVAHN